MEFVFDLIAVLVGLASAFFWYKASKVDVTLLYAKTGGSGFEPIEGGEGHWIVSILNAVQESSRLNKKAALLTAIAIFCSAAAQIAGKWEYFKSLLPLMFQ